MFFSSDYLFQLLLHYKYAIIFPIMVVEGPIITIICGLFASLGYLNLFISYAVIIVGDVAGDAIYYVIGRWGIKRRWKINRYLGLTRERISKLEEHFIRHGGKTLILGKLSHGIGAAALVAAGAARMSFKKFITFNFLATLPKSLIFILVGFYFGKYYVKLSEELNYVTIGLILLAIAGFILYKVVKIKNKNSLKPQ